MGKTSSNEEKGNPPNEVPSEYLTVGEAALLLRVGRNALYEAIQADTIPGVIRVGRLIRIRRAALEPKL